MKKLTSRREALAALAGVASTGPLSLQAIALTGVQPLDGEALAKLHNLRDGIQDSALQRLLIYKEGIPMPYAPIHDEFGQELTLAVWKGKVLVVSFWATWCGFCKRQKPSLDRLQGILGGEDFEVLAINIEHDGLEKVREFYNSLGVTNLAVLVDESGVLSGKIRIQGVPTTLLVDRAGNEVAWLTGEAQWDTDEVVQFMRKMIEMG